MHFSMWTYPWDVQDIGVDEVIAELGTAGIDTISLATSYHAGRFLQPRSPKRKAYFPEDGTIYFEPTPKLWADLRIQPKVADIVREGGDVLAALIARRDAGGPRVSCWTVCLHNTRLGMMHPEAVTRNAFGDPNYYNLCPSHPDVRAYVGALVEDISHRYRPDVIELESPGFMGFAHEYHHEKDAVGLTPEDDFLLSLCFCPSCMVAAAGAGVDVKAARAVVCQWIVEACEREVPQPRLPDFPRCGIEGFRASPALYDYLAWRSNPVLTLISELRARTHPDTKVYLIDLKDGWLGGCELSEVAGLCDGAILCAYAMSPEDVEGLFHEGRRKLGPDRYLGAGFRLLYPEFRSGLELAAQVQSAVRGGAEGLSFYNYGLIPRPRLGWVKAAIGSIPG
ncbi:hypothetical protein [Bradyrhizobium iriomotense]|uniref:Uncharacterized protein n=1 Tax=Bradyrhizobium iriomotense TaxID=441950 RepID=A0ABQ6BBK9_9BRAD|nr:hypothetical protein [Bradyrhizobium iriomotense]GLR91158.1 hypothetical protein GCM10007857_78740 [Bradyrhizobium iriomotense]